MATTLKTLTLRITGMSCEHCAKAVKDALTDVAGVIEVAVNLAENKATVQGNADVVVLVKAVEAEGYGASYGAAVS